MTATISYTTDDELRAKCIAIVQKLDESDTGWEDYRAVAQRFGWGKHESSTLSMRIRRFEDHGGSFPKRMGANGRKVIQLKVTKELERVLRR